jgi:hypothetical protein
MVVTRRHLGACLPADPFNLATALTNLVLRWICHAHAAVLNENEHNTGGPRYIKCFDQIRKAVEGVNKYITLAGPETVGNQYINEFLDPKNHADGRAPEIMSHHAFLGMGSATNTFFKAIDDFMTGDVAGIVEQRDAVAPKTEMILNEWIPFLTDWCDEDDARALFEKHGDALERDPRGGACPNWQDPKSQPTRANRRTLGWNVAAGAFAYGYARLALVGYKYVGADQLIGGPCESVSIRLHVNVLSTALGGCSNPRSDTFVSLV